MTIEFIRRPTGLGEPLGRYSHVSIATGGQIVTVAGQRRRVVDDLFHRILQPVA